MNILHSFQDSEECVSDAYGRCWDTMPPQGTSTLTHATGKLNIRRVELLCKVMSDLKNAGHELVATVSAILQAYFQFFCVINSRKE